MDDGNEGGTLPPHTIEPMRAVTGELPSSDQGWAYEIKWDGVRAIGFVGPAGHLRLQSSNLLDITSRYPELEALVGELGGKGAVLDGEIVTFNERGIPDFGLLQARMHVSDERAIAEWAARRPVVYVVFDLLWFDGHDLTGLPYDDRRHLLERLIGNGPNWQVPPARHGDGAALLEAVRGRGMEGLVAKRRSSVYEPGRRSPAWRKLKVRRQQELVVGGWTPGEGGRAATIGALAVGYHEGGALRYAGRVGSGLDETELGRLQDVLESLATPDCPFDPAPPPRNAMRHARWVRPEVVVEVAFADWSHDGHLRHPSYLGQRDDTDPAGVIREPDPL